MNIGIVLARKGSKRIPRKNMRRLAGSPLIIWTLEPVASATLLDQVIVSSDDPELIELAMLYAKVRTVWRDENLAGDHVPDLPVIIGALERLNDLSLKPDDILVMLRPTAPYRQPEEIDSVITALQAQPTVDSVRSVIRTKQSPQKMYLYSEHMLVPYTSDHRANHPGQDLDPVCYPTGFVDAVRYRAIQQGSMEGVTIKPWISPPDRCVDLDTEEDWAEAERLALTHHWGPGRIET